MPEDDKNKLSKLLIGAALLVIPALGFFAGSLTVTKFDMVDKHETRLTVIEAHQITSEREFARLSNAIAELNRNLSDQTRTTQKQNEILVRLDERMKRSGD